MSAAEAEVRFRITGPAFFFERGIRGSAKEQWCPQPQPFAVKLTAFMPSRQLTKGWNQQSFLHSVVGKTGKTKAITTRAEARNRVNMAANVKQMGLLVGKIG